MPANPGQNARKSTGRNTSSSRKRPKKETPTTSSNSALTNISSISRSLEPVIEYEKTAKPLKNFLIHC
jgi:hypothetical protein